MIYTKIERLNFNPVTEHKEILEALESPEWFQVSVSTTAIIFERVEEKEYKKGEKNDNRR